MYHRNTVHTMERKRKFKRKSEIISGNNGGIGYFQKIQPTKPEIQEWVSEA